MKKCVDCPQEVTSKDPTMLFCEECYSRNLDNLNRGIIRNDAPVRKRPQYKASRENREAHIRALAIAGTVAVPKPSCYNELVDILEIYDSARTLLNEISEQLRWKGHRDGEQGCALCVIKIKIDQFLGHHF